MKSHSKLGNIRIRDDVFINSYKQFNLQYKSRFCHYTAHLYEKGLVGEKNALALNLFNNMFSHFEDIGLLLMAIEKWKRNNKIKPILVYFMQERSGNDWDRLLDKLKNMNFNEAINSFSILHPDDIIKRKYWKLLRNKFNLKTQLRDFYISDINEALYGMINSTMIRSIHHLRKAFNNVKHGQRFLLNLDPLSACIFISCLQDSRIRSIIRTLDINLDQSGLVYMLNILENSTKSVSAFLDWFELCNFPSKIDIDFWYNDHPKNFGNNFKPFSILDFRAPIPK